MTLCDAGPLIALIDRDDRHHQRCVDALAALPPAPLITTWPCLTEAMHLLHRVGGLPAQNELWAFVADGLLRFHLPDADGWRRLQELMNQYADMPLDMADASLLAAAEQLGEVTIFSIDQRLCAVRLTTGAVLNMVP